VLGDVRAALARAWPGEVDLTLAHGVRLRGKLRRVQHGPSEDAALLVMEAGELYAASTLDARLSPGDVVVLARAGLGAHAGAPSDFYPETALPETRVPKAHSIRPRESEMLELYEAALDSLRSGQGGEAAAKVVPVFERVHGALNERFEHDWLLRWNLLESLQKLGLDVPLAATLRRELEQLEVHYQYRQPIASGLSYLSRVARSG
jgi:hypothetical protein